MRRLISLAWILLLTFSQGQLNADVVLNWSGDTHYDIPGSPEWAGAANVLNTYDNVTVTMLGGDGIGGQFNMHDNSQLTMYGGFIGELNLYQNSKATFFGGDYIGSIWVAPESTGWVKLYAVELFYDPLYNTIDYKWLDNDMTHVLQLQGSDTYSHLQFIPEPATLLLLGLGALAGLRHRRR